MEAAVQMVPSKNRGRLTVLSSLIFHSIIFTDRP